MVPLMRKIAAPQGRQRRQDIKLGKNNPALLAIVWSIRRRLHHNREVFSMLVPRLSDSAE